MAGLSDNVSDMQFEKRIIIIHLSPLTIRLRDGFMIADFLNAGYKVEYWDLTAIYRASIVMPDELFDPYVVKVGSLADFETRIMNVSKANSIFILSFDYLKKFDELFGILIRNKCYLTRINIYPNYFGRMKMDLNVVQSLFDLSFVKTILSNFKGIFLSFFTRNNLSVFSHYFSCSPPRTHVINNPNFTIFKSIKEDQVRLIEHPYLLFVDSFFPLHPECAYYSNNSQKHAVAYYRRMRHFFDWLEVKFKMPVIIAAHPSSRYSNSEYGERKIIQHKTALLTRDAEIVLQHGSFSHIFAVLFDKPLVFIKTKQMIYYQDMFASYKISYLARLFGKKAYNIDNIKYDNIIFAKVDERIRNDYIYTQVTSKETEELSNSEIVINEFEKIFNQPKSI